MKTIFQVAKASGNTMDIVSTPVEAKHWYSDSELMQKVCKRAENSKLCNNYDLFNVLKAIAWNYNVDVWILLGIMAHESKFGTSYHKNNREDCRENTNNRHGSKANHTSEWAKRTTTVWKWCRLQKYDTIEEGMISLARTIGIGYKTCMSKGDPVSCISYAYVGDPKVAEHTWVSDVKSFY